MYHRAYADDARFPDSCLHSLAPSPSKDAVNINDDRGQTAYESCQIQERPLRGVKMASSPVRQSFGDCLQGIDTRSTITALRSTTRIRIQGTPQNVGRHRRVFWADITVSRSNAMT